MDFGSRQHALDSAGQDSAPVVLRSPRRTRTAVIVVTYNSRDHFERLSSALRAQTAPFELFIVDNDSTPDQRPSAEDFPDARILQFEDNLGFAAANNRAAELFDGEFLALLNPDAFPEPTWLAELLAAADRWPHAAAFGSTQVAADSPEHFDGLGDCYSFAGVPWRGGFGWSRDALPASDGEIFSPCAAAALYRNADWRAVGGFDESFFCYCEDVDLGFRLRLAGRACIQAPNALVHHIGSASSGRRSRFAVFHGTRNRIWTYLKNMPLGLLLFSLPAHLIATFCFLAISPLRGTGRATFDGILAAMPAFGRIMRERRDIQRARKARTPAIARAMSWWPHHLVKRAPVIKKPVLAKTNYADSQTRAARPLAALQARVMSLVGAATSLVGDSLPY